MASTFPNTNGTERNTGEVWILFSDVKVGDIKTGFKRSRNIDSALTHSLLVMPACLNMVNVWPLTSKEIEAEVMKDCTDSQVSAISVRSWLPSG